MTLLELADAASAHEPLKDGEELVVTDRYILALGRGGHAGANVAQRLRLAPDRVLATAQEVRALVRAHGGRALTWKVASVATPPDLADRLFALGATPADEDRALALALREPPPPAARGISVSRVETVGDFRTFVSITHEVFGMEDRLADELERIAREGDRDIAETMFVRYLAWLEGHAVGAASATFAEAGAILHAGSTRVEARGRGAYRALVAARWEDAVQRGTPALVTWAGSQSAPILRRLGFQEIGEQRILVEKLADR